MRFEYDNQQLNIQFVGKPATSRVVFKELSIKTTIIQQLLYIVFFVLFLPNIILGQNNWTFDEQDYSYSQTISGKVYINGQIANGQFLQLGAFYCDECRGMVKTTGSGCTYNMFYLNVYSNSEFGEELRFVLRDSDENEAELFSVVVFEKDYSIGSIEMPFLWSDEFLYYSTDFFEFSLSPEISATLIDNENKTILVELAQDINLEALSPYFIVAPGARVYLNGELQISEYSNVNLSYPVIYSVVGVDGNQTDWSVNVNITQNNIPQIIMEDFKLYPQLSIDGNVFIESKADGIFYLYTANGKLVSSGIFGSEINKVSIKESGVYVFRLVFLNKKLSFTKKVVII